MSTSKAQSSITSEASASSAPGAAMVTTQAPDTEHQIDFVKNKIPLHHALGGGSFEIFFSNGASAAQTRTSGRDYFRDSFFFTIKCFLFCVMLNLC